MGFASWCLGDASAGSWGTGSVPSRPRLQGHAASSVLSSACSVFSVEHWQRALTLMCSSQLLPQYFLRPFCTGVPPVGHHSINFCHPRGHTSSKFQKEDFQKVLPAEHHSDYSAVQWTKVMASVTRSRSQPGGCSFSPLRVLAVPYIFSAYVFDSYFYFLLVNYLIC